ncbi:nuclear transport factor 2 family protein [Spirillospora sp. CA-294931]|uniref:nuclear transport factor 2 family protein n=1 Tax=Spirillospora sp. CA-294931 TaxID=3240042 RepID=UPI003D8F362D
MIIRRASVGTVTGTLDDLLRRWRDAEARGDVESLDDVLAADFRGDGPRGFVLGKEQWLDRHRLGELTLDAFDWTPTEIRRCPHMAVGRGVQSQRARYRGTDWSGEFVCTVVAVRRDGRWTIVNLQLTRYRPPG